MLVFYCMVGRDVRLLPRLLEHYRALGAAKRLVAVHLSRRDDPVCDDAARIIEEYRATPAKVWVDPDWTVGLHPKVRERALAKYCARDDWIITADCDEFQEYPCPLSEVVEHCERDGYDYVNGEMIDRIAADGTFPDLTDRPLWEQFPLGCRLTGSILQGWTQKVVLSRAWVPLSIGHHHTFGQGMACPTEGCHVAVHHYKWDSTVIQRLRERRDLYLRRNVSWWDESDRFLEYVEANGGRLNLDDPRLGVLRPRRRRPKRKVATRPAKGNTRARRRV